MIYIIATRDKDRSQPLRDILDALELEYKMVDGFNGHKITNAGYFFKKYEGNNSLNLSNMNKGEFGCIISHIIAITMAKSDKCENAIIFEDDARINMNFKNDLEEIKKEGIPENTDILMLGGILLKEHNIIGEKINKLLRKVQAPVYGTHSYLILKNGYDKVLDMLYSMKNTADDLIINRRDEINILITDKWLSYQSEELSVIWPEKTGPGIHSKFKYKS